jgi:hypothetical protein
MLTKKIFLFLFASFVAIFSIADELKPFKFEIDEKPEQRVGQSISQSKVCGIHNLNLPSDYVVFAASASAGRKLGFRVDKIGFEATQVDVAVNYPDAPVVLLLGAYNPVIWNVGWTKKTKIVAVVATGYYKQAITGVERNMPTLISTYESNNNPCGYFFKNAGDIEAINKISQQLFNRDVNIVYPVSNGKVLVGRKLAKKLSLVTSGDNKPEDYYESTPALKGAAAIEYLIKNGYIRHATVEELLKLNKGISQHFLVREEVYLDNAADGTIERVVGYRSNDRAYIVMKTFVYPPGLDEKGVALFFTPKGVSPPTGTHENAIVVDENPNDPPFAVGYPGTSNGGN